MAGLYIETIQSMMTRDAFFYSFKEQVKNEKRAVFLESARGGRYSIAAINPFATVRAVEEGIHIEWTNGVEQVQRGESLKLVEELVKSYSVEKDASLPVFQGGAIGFVTYDYARNIEALPKIAKDDLHLPDVFFYLFESWAVHDAQNDVVTFMKLSSSEQSLEQMRDNWLQFAQSGMATRVFEHGKAIDVKPDVSELQVSFDGEGFEDAVRKIQEYIAAGDVFQVNLSVRQGKAYNADPILMYEAVRSFNPSPYMAYIAHENFAVVSGSPELLVKRTDDEISTRPIAGTRPRGKDVVEDLALANELIQHEKERAEHVMLVDLERNDLGRVAQYGSVEVNEFMVIEKYSHVMHIVSNVRGTVAPDKTNADVLRAMFPGGTITGAPKIRTMEIIEELEPVRRGLYTGSIGWFGYTGDMDFNIVIRTAYIQEGMAYIQAGAGIVIDSIPANEYIESLNKAKAMWQAKAMVDEVLK
ncbi:MAG: anthranilate synthase component I family protein [Lysinibacillus sp.]